MYTDFVLFNYGHVIDKTIMQCYNKIIRRCDNMFELYENAIVSKRNVLNELRSNNMTVQELRFFSIYLSKINPWDISTRAV